MIMLVTPTTSGLLVIAGLCVILGTGLPSAFALGAAAVTALLLDSGLAMFYVMSDTMYSGIANLAFVSIPMFVLMGAVVASSPAGSDLYTADRTSTRLNSSHYCASRMPSSACKTTRTIRRTLQIGRFHFPTPLHHNQHKH